MDWSNQIEEADRELLSQQEFAKRQEELEQELLDVSD